MATATPPTLPLTYPDLVCVDDVDPFAAETTSDLQTLEQDVYHLLIQEPGSNLDALDLGIGIEGYLSSSQTDFLTIAATIDRELVKDSRIDGSVTTITPPSPAAPTWLVVISLTVSGTVIPLTFTYDDAAGLEPFQS